MNASNEPSNLNLNNCQWSHCLEGSLFAPVTWLCLRWDEQWCILSHSALSPR